MITVGVFRLGADVKRVESQNGAFGSLSLAGSYYDPANKNTESKGRETQWIHATVGGKTFENMEKFLTKGSLFEVSLADVHARTYQRKDGGDGYDLVGRVLTINFAGGKNEQGAAGQQSQAPAQQAGGHAAAPKAPAGAPPTDGGFEDDDIPF